MIHTKLLMSAQQVVASAFVGEGIRVIFDADVPRADLENRVMHLRPLPEEVSDKEMIEIRADCDHELAHFIYTDYEVIKGINDEFLRLVTFALEDGFIERKHGERYLGAGDNLLRSNKRHLRNLKRTASEKNRRSRSITALTLLSFGYSEEDVYKSLGDDIYDYIEQISDILIPIGSINSTQDSLDYARKITTRWRWLQPREDTKKKKKDLTDVGIEDGTPLRVENSLLHGRRKKSISRMKLSRRNNYRSKTDKDVIEIIPDLSIDANGLLSEFMDSVRQIAGPLRRRILMEFRGTGLVLERHQKSGDVDSRSLHKIQLNSFNVFKRRIIGPAIDTDITLMVDCSGSMVMDSIAFLNNPELRKQSRLWVASQAACACSMVLDLLRVPNEVLAWTTKGYGEPDTNYDRVTPLRHMIVKPHNSAFHRSQVNFLKLGLFENPAENIDGESILWGAQRLASRARRAARRPLLIVFSDGEPLSTPEEPEILCDHLRKSVQRIESAGVTTIGVGIQSRAVENFYPRNTVVNDLSDLIGTFYKILRRELRVSRKVG